LFLQGTLGEILCEELPAGMCSFSIASSGKRCALETSASSDGGAMKYHCKTSEVVVKNMPEWIESAECMSACGVDRFSLGISSDSLLDPLFTASLCSPACYYNCPNIIDLYYNLALAEGVFLPEFCKAQRSSSRREMTEFLSSGAASGPVSATAAGPAYGEVAGPISSESSASLACAPTSI
ncbi:uncharacterized protein LOC132309560, partial [Cornus florida]|uniref:uncharacterized protein LOC132309560 n=1 Tax=Cornus florida TaxID=4283 RepID=UPI00289D4405